MFEDKQLQVIFSNYKWHYTKSYVLHKHTTFNNHKILTIINFHMMNKEITKKFIVAIA